MTKKCKCECSSKKVRKGKWGYSNPEGTLSGHIEAKLKSGDYKTEKEKKEAKDLIKRLES